MKRKATASDLNKKYTEELISQIRKLAPQLLESIKVPKNGDDIDKSLTDSGESMLILAARSGCLEVVEMLLQEHGANIESSNNNGVTALIYASLTGQESIVRFLLSQNANIEAANKEGGTALIAAAKQGNTEVVQLLLDHNAMIDAESMDGAPAIIYAARYGQDAVVQILINKGANIQAQSKDGKTALMAASIYGYDSVIRILLAKNAEIESKCKHGVTALMYAAKNNRESAVRILLEAGANKEASNMDGITALILAASLGNAGIIQLMLDHDANIETKCNLGGSALMYAARHGQVASVKLLLENGANSQAESNIGNTALIYAQLVEQGITNNNVIKILELAAAMNKFVLDPTSSVNLEIDVDLVNDESFAKIFKAIVNTTGASIDKQVILHAAKDNKSISEKIWQKLESIINCDSELSNKITEGQEIYKTSSMEPDVGVANNTEKHHEITNLVGDNVETIITTDVHLD